MLGKRRLTHVDGEVAVVVLAPGEGGAEEEIDVAHEVNFAPLS